MVTFSKKLFFKNHRQFLKKTFFTKLLNFTLLERLEIAAEKSILPFLLSWQIGFENIIRKVDFSKSGADTHDLVF